VPKITALTAAQAADSATTKRQPPPRGTCTAVMATSATKKHHATATKEGRLDVGLAMAALTAHGWPGNVRVDVTREHVLFRPDLSVIEVQLPNRERWRPLLGRRTARSRPLHHLAP
jgi:hypothetical protein